MYNKKVGWILDEVLERYKNKFGIKTGEKPSFTYDAFKALIKDLSIEEQVDDLHIGRYYNQSLAIHTSHLTSDAFSKIRNKFEFYEALARLADDS